MPASGDPAAAASTSAGINRRNGRSFDTRTSITIHPCRRPRCRVSRHRGQLGSSGDCHSSAGRCGDPLPFKVIRPLSREAAGLRRSPIARSPIIPPPSPAPGNGRSGVAMAEQYIYVMKDLRKIYPPNREVLKGIWLSFLPGAKIGVLGLNGAGKSTLLKIMAGVVTDFGGEAWPAKGVKVGYLAQEPLIDETKDGLGNVEEGVAGTRALLTRFDQINARFAEDLAPEEMEKLLEEQARVQDAIGAAHAWELDRTLAIAMDALRLPPGDSAVGHLAGGERRRVALCRLLLQRPDLLLLDEPTNHLDAESVAWLERFLAEYPGTVVAITHDRYFLDNVAGWILELDRGSGIPWEGNYSSWLEQKQQRLALEEKQESSRRRTLERELEWVRMSPRARQAKGKARLTHYEQLLAEDRDAAKRV